MDRILHNAGCMPEHRILTIVSATIAALTISACTSAPWNRPLETKPIETGAGTTTSARKFLEGRWTLVSYTLYPPGEADIALDGPGTLTYDDFGNLAMEVSVDAATAKKLETIGVPTANGVLRTTGRSVVDLQHRTLTYVLEGQPPRGAPFDPLGLNRPRHWEVEGDVLTLTTRADDGTPLSVGKWRKVG
jgi:hypothetical protein